MRNIENDVLRVENVIQTDRANCKEDFCELVIADVAKILRDYFDFKEQPLLEIQKESGLFKIKITLSAVNLYKFNTV